MKGIILAGGSGTRLYPLTLGVSKQLMPIYDKPMVYYPLSTLMEAGIREILIISGPEHLGQYEKLLGDGRRYGCEFYYVVQDQPRGLADAFIVGEEFIGQDKVAMILGDNVFYGTGLIDTIRKNANPHGGVIFAARVHDPERYGVVEFDKNGKVLSIEEKPKIPRSNYAIPGLYLFDKQVSSIAKKLKPSDRGEIEITEIHKAYLKKGQLKVGVLERGTVWLDTGTFDSMVSASEYVRVIEKRQDQKIGSIEEAAFRAGFIDDKQLIKLSKPLLKSGYGKYLRRVAKGDV